MWCIAPSRNFVLIRWNNEFYHPETERILQFIEYGRKNGYNLLFSTERIDTVGYAPHGLFNNTDEAKFTVWGLDPAGWAYLVRSRWVCVKTWIRVDYHWNAATLWRFRSIGVFHDRYRQSLSKPSVHSRHTELHSESTAATPFDRSALHLCPLVRACVWWRDARNSDAASEKP